MFRRSYFRHFTPASVLRREMAAPPCLMNWRRGFMIHGIEGAQLPAEKLYSSFLGAGEQALLAMFHMQPAVLGAEIYGSANPTSLG